MPIAVVCSISKGAFSGERVFEIQTAGEPYVGLASPIYLWDEQGRRTPPPHGDGVASPGIVAARLIRREGARAIVVVPGNEIVEVDSTLLRDRPALGVGR